MCVFQFVSLLSLFCVSLQPISALFSPNLGWWTRASHCWSKPLKRTRQKVCSLGLWAYGDLWCFIEPLSKILSVLCLPDIDYTNASVSQYHSSRPLVFLWLSSISWLSLLNSPHWDRFYASSIFSVCVPSLISTYIYVLYVCSLSHLYLHLSALCVFSFSSVSIPPVSTIPPIFDELGARFISHSHTCHDASIDV